MKVVVMGLGYIGLPTAALIASKGIRVCGVDVNREVVDTVNKGKIHIVEPDLDGLVHKVVLKGFLRADTKPEEADVFLIAVPTPFGENYNPDLRYVEEAVRMIIPYLRERNIVIIESTVPVGATEEMYSLILRERGELDGRIYMAYCPERVLPGRILYELEHNDRVIGGVNQESTRKAMGFYSLFVRGNLHATDARTAEMCKLVENAYRDVNIAFANEVSMIADKFGIDVWELIELANRHPRVNILRPGVGVGGHCIAVDPWFLITQNPEESKLMRAAREVNLNKTQWVLRKIRERIEAFRRGVGREPKVACFGLSYKPDVDDLRESPALYITQALINEGYDVIAVEPNLKDRRREEIEEIQIVSINEALDKADMLVFLVAHTPFKRLNFREVDDKVILDFCGILG